MHRILTPPLTASGLRISELGFGCASYWCESSFPAEQAVKLVVAAYEAGITYFDTGSSYGAGQAELRLGSAVKLLDRNTLIISTKAGTFMENRKLRRDFSPQSISKSLDSSLKRLGVDFVDILFLHAPTPRDLNEGVLNTLMQLKESGKVRCIGVNSFNHGVIRECIELPFDGVMLNYNVLDQDSEPLIDLLAAKGKFIIGATAIAQALFLWKTILSPSRKSLYYLMRALARHRHRSDLLASRKLSFLNQYHGVSGPQVAIAFVLRHPSIASAVFGTTSLQHLMENIGASSVVLDEEMVQQIHDVMAK